MNGYPTKFIDNAMKTPRSVREKTEYNTEFERILKKAGIQVHHSSEDKFFRSLCTHKDRIKKSHITS